MKNYKYLLMSLVAASTLVGCNDDEFLKEDPKTIYTVDNAFEKSSQVDATISRAYYTVGITSSWIYLTLLTVTAVVMFWAVRVQTPWVVMVDLTMY